MRPRRRRYVGIVAAVLIVALAGAYAAFVAIGGGTSAAPPVSLATSPSATPSTTESSGSTATPATFDGTWTLEAAGASFVGYRVREQFSFLPAPTDAVGRTTAVTGSLTVDGLRITAVSVQADMTQLHSDKAMRDQRMQTMGLETDRFPTASFALTSPLSFSKRPAAGRIVHVVARGNLTLHGTTHPVRIPLQARWTGNQIQVVGSLPVVLADYGITPPSIGPVTVQDHGTMELELVFAKGS